MPLDLTAARTLEVRAQVRADDAGARELTAIAVPWDSNADIGGWYTERVQRGAVEPAENVLLFWRHRDPIGRITSYRDTDAGWEITAVISQTPQGDEAYTLLRDGVIDRMSIGFDPIEHIETTNEDGSLTVTRTRISVSEVSLVPFPAFDGAKVSDVRSATQPTLENPVPAETETLTRADLTEMIQGMEDLTRSVALIQAGPTDRQPVSEFRSIGDYVRALVAGEERAKRAFDGAVSGDGILKDQWIGDIVQLQSQAQPILNAFTTGSLPAEGLTVEWGLLESDTTEFDRQIEEGDELLHGKVSLTTKNAPVYTAGGWSSLSIQAIQRTTNLSLLDTTWTALALKAARYVERLTRKTVLDAVAAQKVAGETVDADLTTARGIVALLLDLREHYDDLDLTLSGLMVSKDVFLDLYDVPEFASILSVSGAGTDKLGTLDAGALDADLAGLKIKLFPKATAGTTFAYDKAAVKTLEAPGAPFRLTNDVSVVDLTKPLGLYTYVSSFAQQPAGLVPIV